MTNKPKNNENGEESSEKPETQTNGEAFSLSRVRLNSNFGELAGAKKLLLTVPIRKPSPQDFFRVHPGNNFRLDVGVIELKEERETYLVIGEMFEHIPAEIVPKKLYTVINRQGVVMLWPVRLPGLDGRLDEWNRSAHDAAKVGETSWIRLVSNKSLGSYEVTVAPRLCDEPKWSEESFEKLVEIAFKGKIIEDMDHPVLRRLRGEV